MKARLFEALIIRELGLWRYNVDFYRFPGVIALAIYNLAVGNPAWFLPLHDICGFWLVYDRSIYRV
jgi:hypothetical protein